MLAETLLNFADQRLACLNASLPPLDVDAAILIAGLCERVNRRKAQGSSHHFRGNTFVAATATIGNVACEAIVKKGLVGST